MSKFDIDKKLQLYATTASNLKGLSEDNQLVKEFVARHAEIIQAFSILESKNAELRRCVEFQTDANIRTLSEKESIKAERDSLYRRVKDLESDNRDIQTDFGGLDEKMAGDDI